MNIFGQQRQLWKARIPRTPKAILLALANFLGKNKDCWPSYERIAQMVGVARRTVIRASNWLVAHGFLIRRPRRDDEKNCFETNLYTIVWERIPGGGGSDTVSPGVVTNDHQGSDPMSPRSDKRSTQRDLFLEREGAADSLKPLETVSETPLRDPEPLRADLPIKTSDQPSTPHTSAAPGGELFEKELFEWVLNIRIPRFPKQPASPRVVARSLIRKHREDLQAEFLEWKAATTQPVRAEDPTPVDPPSKIAMLRAKWNTGMAGLRDQVKKSLAEHPEWGITLEQVSDPVPDELTASGELSGG